MKNHLISPYGGKLVSLLVHKDERQKFTKEALSLKSIKLTFRQLLDLDLLANGSFSPLTQFMGKEDYTGVVCHMRLANGTLFPIPITLTVNEKDSYTYGERVCLRTPQNDPIAIMTIDEIYEWDFQIEAQHVLGTVDDKHPMVTEMRTWGKYCVAGPIQMISSHKFIDFNDLRADPLTVRNELRKLGNPNIVAFQTRNPMHRVHEEMTKKAADTLKATLLLHPVVGSTRPGDIDYITRVRCYKALYEKYYNHDSTLLRVLPLAMRMAGPREALWHAIIRRNYGANSFIVGRDHASPGSDSNGSPFYAPYAAHEIVLKYSKEIGVTIATFHEFVYLPDEDRYEQQTLVDKNRKYFTISGTKIRSYLSTGKTLPKWISRTETAKILSNAYPPPSRKGFCLWFTGLPCSGKTTIASLVVSHFHSTGRLITFLDGDEVRAHLSKGLGFSREDRDENVLRMGFVSSEVVKHNGIVVVAAISPYEATREAVRRMMPGGKFILIHVDTPLAECERRDLKGLYKKARTGEVKFFTGVDDMYETPRKPDITIKTARSSPKKNLSHILSYLQKHAYIKK